jgi:hypothetical protein
MYDFFIYILKEHYEHDVYIIHSTPKKCKTTMIV